VSGCSVLSVAVHFPLPEEPYRRMPAAEEAPRVLEVRLDPRRGVGSFVLRGSDCSTRPFDTLHPITLVGHYWPKVMSRDYP